MAFDGGFLYKTVLEINEAQECHIDKIYQPSKDELVFLLRKKGFVKRLYISAKNSAARIHFTQNKYENPIVPPNFCMLLRKHLSSAKFINAETIELERIAILNFSATNELGDIQNLRLVCEFIGNKPNIILLNPDGKIIDAIKHSDVETSERLILPNAVYVFPKLEKENPLNLTAAELLKKLALKQGELANNLLGILQGFSPLICREIQDISEQKNLEFAFNTILSSLKTKAKPTMLLNSDGTPFEFSYTDINQYGTKFKKVYFETCCELLDAFYFAKENYARIKNSANDIIKLVNNLKNRTKKRLALRLADLKKCENRESLRIYGELLKANLHLIKNGSDFAIVKNYYDENLCEIKVPLNPALSPAKNAEKYFKDYKKTYSAEQMLTELTEKDNQELIYLDSVLDAIERSENIADISEIREELSSLGYIKQPQNLKKQKKEKLSFIEDVSDEGYRIIIGKNNLQNDYITTRLASKLDMWFHVKNIPGSHVVVFCDGQELSDSTILKAAELAAINSKASSSANVPVDYTQIKNVKKPSGAKPGMVIYTTNKTLYVTPKKEKYE